MNEKINNNQAILKASYHAPHRAKIRVGKTEYRGSISQDNISQEWYIITPVSPMVYTQELATAANWIWEHKDEPQFWNWPVLTRHNDAEDSLNFPDTIAWNVFTILEQRGLMIPLMAEKDGKTFPAFGFNFTKDKEWNELIKKKGIWRLHIFPFLRKVWDKGWAVIIFIIALFITSFFGSILENLAKDIYDVHIHPHTIAKP